MVVLMLQFTFNTLISHSQNSYFKTLRNILFQLAYKHIEFLLYRSVEKKLFVGSFKVGARSSSRHIFRPEVCF